MTYEVNWDTKFTGIIDTGFRRKEHASEDFNGFICFKVAFLQHADRGVLKNLL